MIEQFPIGGASYTNRHSDSESSSYPDSYSEDDEWDSSSSYSYSKDSYDYESNFSSYSNSDSDSEYEYEDSTPTNSTIIPVAETEKWSLHQAKINSLHGEEDGRECSICQDNIRCMVLNCGHSSLCALCALEMKYKTAECPYCRASIKKMRRCLTKKDYIEISKLARRR